MLMEQKNKRKIINRISYISGHLEGVKKMIEEDRYCVDIIHQNKGIISAIKKVNRMVLENHLHTCVRDAVMSKNKKEQEDKIRELLDILENSNEQK
jgi:CsoR family transcriptional regulator, copper-sensing transcriptional repressor